MADTVPSNGRKTDSSGESAPEPLTDRPAYGNGRGASSDPVFVLCAGRSGSTLLRFLLDAHPDLACPPETNVPALCGQLANVWALIEGAPLSANRGDEPPEIPDTVIAGVRETMDRMVGSYLARRGKRRYCDKSLGTARFAYLMTRVWPEAKFICLFRHPMDVIASGVEACPWGLNGYGFDPFIAETPGNSVFALARFWMENAATISSAEEQWPERCHRIRYEDMVGDPQGTADSLYEFLGVAPVPDIERKIFAAERERFGPADYKIWHTSRISTESVGRGWTIPAGLIGPAVRETINELCEKLGYIPVDDGWGTAEQPADFRMPPAAEDGGDEAETPAPAVVPAPVPDDTPMPNLVPLLRERLQAGAERADEAFAERWAPCGAESFLIMATPDDNHGAASRWRVDLAAKTVSPDGETAESGDEDEDQAGWDLIGSAWTWQQVVSGAANMSVALRRHDLRYCDFGDAGPVQADTRIAMLADLLGLTSWGRARADVEVMAGDKT
jgi:hypothetical protein